MKRRDTGYTHWFNLEFEEILQGYTYDFYRFALLPGQLAISIASLPLAYSDRLQQLISAKCATIKTDFECSIAVEERVLCPDGKKEVETVNIDVLGAVGVVLGVRHVWVANSNTGPGLRFDCLATGQIAESCE